MSDGEYAEMIEIPVSTCEMVVLPKKRKKKNLRKRVISKVNKSLKNEDNALIEQVIEPENVKEEEKTEPKKKFSFDIVSAQVVAIFVLIVTIMVTNIFWEDSGINTLLKGVFANDAQTEDAREYYEFQAFAPSKASQVEVEKGVMTVSSGGSIYAPCLGVIEEIVEGDGKYTVTISHSDRFKTIIRNADYAYFDVGETVYEAVPVCFSGDSCEVLMYNDNTLLTNYTIADGSIVWQS